MFRWQYSCQTCQVSPTKWTRLNSYRPLISTISTIWNRIWVTQHSETQIIVFLIYPRFPINFSKCNKFSRFQTCKVNSTRFNNSSCNLIAWTICLRILPKTFSTHKIARNQLTCKTQPTCPWTCLTRKQSHTKMIRLYRIKINNKCVGTTWDPICRRKSSSKISRAKSLWLAT